MFLDLDKDYVQRFEDSYSKENPWKFNNTVNDFCRRSIFLQHYDEARKYYQCNKALAAGCGEGYIVKELADKSDIEVDAFDISSKAISYAKKRNNSKGINYFQYDIFKIDQLPDTYDMILCEEVLFYFTEEEMIDIIKKVRQRIIKGGIFKLTMQTKEWPGSLHAINHKRLSEILQQMGFSVISILPYWIFKKSIIDKFLFRGLGLLYKLTHNQNIITILKKRTLKYPLEECFKISVLAYAN